MAGRTDTHGSAGSSARCARPRTSWSSSGRPGCATTSAALRRAMEKQTVVFGDGTDADVVAFAEDPLEAAVQVFHVRGGRVRGQRGWVVEKTEDLTTGDLVHHFCTQVYGGEADGEAGPTCPREVLVPELPADAEALADWLSGLRGSRVALRVPQRGDKKALMETVARNAGEALHPAQAAPGRRPDRPQPGAGGDRRRRSACRARRCASSATTSRRSRAPTWWPAWSSSRTGWPARASTAGSSSRGATDDVSAISEVLRRRFARYLRRPTASPGELTDDRPARADRPETGRARKFAYPPQLVVVDGGAPQVNAAARGAARAGHRRRRGLRPGQAAGGGVAARRGVPGDPAPYVRGALPAATGPRRGAPVRHHLPPAAAVEADDRVRAGQRARAGRGPAQGAAAPVRLAEAAGRGQRRGDRRGAGHRPPHRRGDPGRAQPGPPGGTTRRHPGTDAAAT